MGDWQQFAKSAAQMMRDARENKMPLKTVADFFDETPEITDADLRRHAVYIVFEIDGSPGYYDELILRLEASVSEADMVRYVND